MDREELQSLADLIAKCDLELTRLAAAQGK
jgi:hypothetical protein